MTLPGCSQGCFPTILPVPGLVLPSSVIPRWSSGLGSAAKEVQLQAGAGMAAVLEWHHHPAQQSCAKPHGKVGKCLFSSRADHCWAAAVLGAVCQTSRSPACANSQGFLTFSRVNYLPGNFALWQWCGWWQPKHRPEPDCSEQSRKAWGIWNLKPHNLFRTTFLGEFLSLYRAGMEGWCLCLSITKTAGKDTWKKILTTIL